MPVVLVVIGNLGGLVGALLALIAGHSLSSVLFTWYATGWIAVLSFLLLMTLNRSAAPLPLWRRHD